MFWRNSINLSGNRPAKDSTVSAEWYDKGIVHFYELSEPESTAHAALLKNLMTKRHLCLPETNIGELSYNINYAGTKNIGYAIRGFGWIVVFNRNLFIKQARISIS